MPVITLPTDGQVPYGNTLRTAITTINDQVDINTGDIADLGANWQSYTPTLTNATVGNGSVTGSYVRIGDTVTFQAKFTLGSTSTVTGVVTISIPVVAANDDWLVSGSLEDSGTDRLLAFCLGKTDKVEVFFLEPSSPGATFGFISATAPFTWTTNDFIAISGVYQAA